MSSAKRWQTYLGLNELTGIRLWIIKHILSIQRDESILRCHNINGGERKWTLKLGYGYTFPSQSYVKVINYVYAYSTLSWLN